MFKSGFILFYNFFQLMCILFQATYVLVNYSKLLWCIQSLNAAFEGCSHWIWMQSCQIVSIQYIQTFFHVVNLFFMTSLFSTTSWMKADGLLCSGTRLLPQTPFSISRQPLLGGAHICCVTWAYISSAGNKLLVLLCDFSYFNYSTSELIGILL